MRLALVSGPVDPGNALNGENTLIQSLNASVGLNNPAAGTVLLGSTTVTGALYSAELPANFFAAAGDGVDFFGFGTTAADTNTKTLITTLANGTTSVAINQGSTTVSGAAYRDNFHLVWDGSTFRYASEIDANAIRTLAQGSTGTTLVNTAALTLTVSAKSDAAASGSCKTASAPLGSGMVAAMSSSAANTSANFAGTIREKKLPWAAKDAVRHTKEAASPKAKRQWKDVANSMLKSGKSEGAAVRAANAVVKRRKK